MGHQNITTLFLCFRVITSGEASFFVSWHLLPGPTRAAKSRHGGFISQCGTAKARLANISANLQLIHGNQSGLGK